MPTPKRGHKYLRRILVAVIILGAIAYGAWYVWKQYQEVDTTSRFDGEVVCLPLRASPEPADEATCEKGLKNKDGFYYAVEDISQNTLKLEEKLAIKGNLEPVTDATDGEYAISGVIAGKLLTKQR